MASNEFCGFCGQLPETGMDPHPNHDSCPFEDNHKQHDPNDSLVEAIQKTTSRNSICLSGWSGSYPVFRTVYETRTWLPTTDTSTGSYEGHEKYDTSYFKKTIWATSNLYDFETYFRIEYDPTTDSLIDWYAVTGDSEEQGDGSFGAYIRKDDPDVSFFGSTLPG